MWVVLRTCVIACACCVYVCAFVQFETKLASILVSLRERMRFYKLRVTQGATGIAATFNEQFRPEIIPEANDPFRIDWIHSPVPDKSFLVGEEVGGRFFFASAAELGWLRFRIGSEDIRPPTAPLCSQMAYLRLEFQHQRLPVRSDDSR